MEAILLVFSLVLVGFFLGRAWEITSRGQADG
jgi:hypothetical protein